MGEAPFTGSAWRVRSVGAVAGGSLGVLTSAWILFSEPLAGGGTFPAPLPLVAACLGLAAGFRWRDSAAPGARRLHRSVVALPLLAGVLCVVLPGVVLALSPFAVGPTIWRTLATLIVVGAGGVAAGYALADRLQISAAWFWLAMTGGLLLVTAGPPHIPLLYLVPGAMVPLAGVLWLVGSTADARTQRRNGGNAVPFAAVGLAAGLAAVTLHAWIRFLLLICGTTLHTRQTLLASVLVGLALGAVAATWRPPKHEARSLAVGVVFLSSAVLATTLTAISPVLAAWLLELSAGSAVAVEAAAWPLGLTVLMPMSAGFSLGLCWLCPAGAPARTGRWITVSVAVAVVVAETILVARLGPGRLLLFCAATIPLGAALPAFLGAAGPVARRPRLVGTVIVLLLSAVGLFVQPPQLRLLSAGVGWQPDRFLFQQRPALPDRLGRRRVIDAHTSSLGLAARRQQSGGSEELSWQGAAIVGLDQPARSRQQLLGALPTLFHSDPGNLLLVGDASGEMLAGALSVAPSMSVDSRPAAPGLAAVMGGAAATRAAETTPDQQEATGYDVIILRPLPARVAASGLSWSVESLHAARQALAGNGSVLALVVDPAHQTTAGFLRVVSTFVDVMPHASLWFDGNGLLLVATVGQPALNLTGFERRFRQANLPLRVIGVDRPVDLLGRFVMGAAALRFLTADAESERVTDPRLAFEPAPGHQPTEGTGLLARLVVVADQVLTLFEGLGDAERTTLETQILEPAAATAHLLSSLGWAGEEPPLAQEKARRVYEQRPNDPLVRRQLAAVTFQAALTAMAQADDAQARAAVEQAVVLDPDNLDYQLLLFDLFRRHGHAKAAAQRRDHMAARFAHRFPVLLLLAHERLDKGDVEAGDSLLRRAAMMGYESAELTVGRARVAFMRQQTGDGHRLVAQALGLGPDTGVVLAYTGGRLLADGHRDEARTYLRQALDLGQDTSEVNAALGEIALHLEQNEQALTYLSRAVALDAGAIRALVNLGSVLLFLNRPAEALPHLNAAVLQAPNNPKVLLNLAVALFRQGDLPGARQQVEKIGSRLPENPILDGLREELGMAPPGP